MIINIYLVLFFKHFEWMRLLIGHIYALQAVDVPDEDVDDDHVDEDVDDDVDGDIDIDIDDHDDHVLLLWKAGFGDMCFPSLDGFHLRTIMIMMKTMLMKTRLTMLMMLTLW